MHSDGNEHGIKAGSQSNRVLDRTCHLRSSRHDMRKECSACSRCLNVKPYAMFPALGLHACTDEPRLTCKCCMHAQLRPPVEHRFGRGPLTPDEQPAPISVFRHRLLHHFSLTLFCKLPVEPISTMEDTRYSLMVCCAS